MPSTIFYADAATGKLSLTNTGSYQTQVTFTNTGGALTGFTPKAYAGQLEIPSTLAGSTVTSIGVQAFSLCTGLTSVTFEAGSQITTFNTAAFEQCTSLTSITIPASVTTISNLTFSNCTSLASITIPSTVTNLDRSAFQTCSKLTSISVHPDNQNYSSVDGLLYNRGINTLISCPSGKSGSIATIPNTVKILGTHAFSSCSKLTSVAIPNSVEYMSDFLFYGCGNLTSVTFESVSKVASIGQNAFFNCVNFASINIPASVTYIDGSGFIWSGLTNMYIPTINGLNLTPSSTPVTKYGRTFTVSRDAAADAAVAAAAAAVAAAAICFPAGTKVTTDQGDIAIEKLIPKVHTIRGKKIVGITQSIPLQKHIISIEKDALAKNVPSVTTQISKEHKLFYKGKMVKARDLVEVCQGVTAIPYNGEILYNVLLKKYEKMMVNNLICETLDPENIVAKIYNRNFQPTEKSKICEKLNHIIRTNNIPEYKKLYASLK